MFSIRCPVCGDIQYLTLADWEDFIGWVLPGQQVRVGLVCSNCHNEFLLQLNLSQVRREEA